MPTGEDDHRQGKEATSPVVIQPRHEDRPWGHFDQFIHNELFTLKILTVNPGEATSLQYHNHRQELWIVLSGSGFIDIADQRYQAKKNSCYIVPHDVSHRLTASAQPLVVLEVSTGKFDEQDIVRIKDKYGRRSDND